MREQGAAFVVFVPTNLARMPCGKGRVGSGQARSPPLERAGRYMYGKAPSAHHRGGVRMAAGGGEGQEMASEKTRLRKGCGALYSGRCTSTTRLSRLHGQNRLDYIVLDCSRLVVGHALEALPSLSLRGGRKCSVVLPCLGLFVRFSFWVLPLIYLGLGPRGMFWKRFGAPRPLYHRDVFVVSPVAKRPRGGMYQSAARLAVAKSSLKLAGK